MLSGLLSLYKGREPKIQDALGRNPKLHFFKKTHFKIFFFYNYINTRLFNSFHEFKESELKTTNL